MREIKFKIKISLKDDWSEFYTEEEREFIHGEIHEVITISLKHGNLCISDEEGVSVISIFKERCEVYELMQYTGLKDKNGVEIYDGDIDKSGNVIKWNSDKAMYALYSKENNLMSWPLFGKEIEVIGNIHSNPELLK